jgi:hypothetical protein
VVAARKEESAAFVATKVQVPVAKPLTWVPDTEQIDEVVVVYVSAPVPDPPDTWKLPVVPTPKPAGIERNTRLTWFCKDADPIVTILDELALL